MTHSNLHTNRIDHLFDVTALQGKLVTIVGLGSGGAPVCDHLTMNGVRRWHLYDPDTLEAENLVKHPRRRADLGRLKVDIQREWILDRNPTAEIESFPDDVRTSLSFERSIVASDLVLICADSKVVREYISDVCVRNRVSYVVGSVFRTGIGGEALYWLPGTTGCFRCLQLFALKHNMDLTDEALGLTEEEEERIYGMGQTDFRGSGLSLDIQSISLLQARMALSLLLPESNRRFPSLKANWIILGNRPGRGIFTSHFEVRQMRLKPQTECFCAHQVAPQS